MGIKKTVLSFGLGLLGLQAITLATVGGCNRQETESEDESPQAVAPETSDYPLRVWIAANVSDASRIERQWLAGSEQPIDIRVLTADELLAEEACDCELVFFPSRLLGEIVHRDWIVKLPASVTESETAVEIELASIPPAVQAQASYGGTKYGLALGCSIPVIVASDLLASQLSSAETSWDEITEAIDRGTEFALPPADEIDKQALVDRFLALVGTLTERNPNYGLLFELQTMSPRLSEPEFVRAAEILHALSRQEGGAAAVVGSHSAAWRFATENPASAVAIASPALLDDEQEQSVAGSMLRITAAKAVPGWNTGGGLVAALAADCRQTSLTVGMLRWLRQKKTREALAAVIRGVESGSPDAGADDLSWRIRAELREVLNDFSLPQEPRLVSTDLYRLALADELIKLLKEEKSIEEALSDAAASWSEISRQASSDLQVDYEKSLGLTL